MVVSASTKKAIEVIQSVVDRVGYADMQLLRLELRKAYPFAERKRYQYKAWLRESKRALRRQPLGTRIRRKKGGRRKGEGQRELF